VSLTFAAVDIGASLQQALDTFFAFLPRLLGFLIVLAVGFVVAKVVKSLLTKLLGRSASTGPCIPVQSDSTSTRLHPT
jgi:hypothetical protein